MAEVLMAVEVSGLLLAVVALWFGLKKFDLSRFYKSVLGVLDLALMVLAVVRLGWLGLGLFLAVNLVALLATSVHLAMRKESLLVYAATQARSSKGEMETLFKRLRRSHRVFRVLGPLQTAVLISHLAQRARSPLEIEEMAVPIALLWVAHKPDIESLVDRFDRLLRLYHEPASNAMRVADTLTVSSRSAAATFEEMLDATIAAVDPSSS